MLAPFRVIVLCYLLLLSGFAVTVSSAQQFNYEVEKRVLDRLRTYLGDPVLTLDFLRRLLERDGFPHHLNAPDRDEYLAVSHSLQQPLVYYGSETGICVGYYFGLGYHREPGYSGYEIGDTNVDSMAYFKTCVDESGALVDCLHTAGDNYIQKECDVNDATCLVPCPDEVSQTGCDYDDLDGEAQAECEKAIKWCSTYSIETVNEGETLGYIPITNHCHNTLGQFSEVVEGVENTDGSGDISSCYHSDGETLVQRKDEAGAFAYCGGNGTVCSGMLEGGYSSSNYDPRYRPWYTETKERQMGTWHDVFPFFTLGLGITYSLPYYKTIDDDRKVFDGVLAVDYRFEDIASFLVEDYQNEVTEVVMFEAKEPHYVIGTSTGTPAAINMLTEDLTQPCKDPSDSVPCTPVRVKMADLTGLPMDDVLVRAFQRHKEADFPQELLSVLASDDIESDFYVSQSAIYDEQAERGLEWRIIVVSPGTKSTGDSITAANNSGVFAAICSMAILGFLVCSYFCWYFYSKRSERSIVHSDWRFTCAFLAGSALLNISSLTLLGENTKATCLSRAWVFNFFFTAALAPLFVKTWRLCKLVGSSNIVRKGISHQQVALYCLPFIAIQVVILLIFTFVDPPAPTEFIENDEGAVTQLVICDSERHALWYTEVVYQAGLVGVGCYLAYKSRNLTKEFNEVKPMMFSMYNIAFVGIIVALLSNFANFGDGNGRSILQAVGIVWGSVCSTAAFVLPRMLSTERSIRDRKAGARSSRVRVSGINPSGVIGDSRVEMNMSSSNNDSELGIINKNQKSFAEEKPALSNPPKGNEESSNIVNPTNTP